MDTSITNLFSDDQLPEAWFCSQCRKRKPREDFVSRRRCRDCAMLRKCFTCGERKPITDFPQETSKGCLKCRQTGRAKEQKAQRAALRYANNAEARREHNRNFYASNPMRYTARQENHRKQKRIEIRNIVLDHFHKVCACCGESEPLFLTIDHIDGNGNLHRRLVGKADMWRWLVNNKFPPGFQLLCFNCNAGKYRNGGTCPHQEIKRTLE